MADDVIYREGETPTPVSREDPLVGLETLVLKVWLENSRPLRKAYKTNPRPIEQAVRLRVFETLQREAELRAQGLKQHEAEEFTRPDLWRPPAVPTT